MSKDKDPAEAAGYCCSQWVLVVFAIIVLMLGLISAYVESLMH